MYWFRKNVWISTFLVLFLLLLIVNGVRLLKFTSKNNDVVPSENQSNSKTLSNNCPNLFVSWNLENFGKSKSSKALTVMASVLAEADIVAIQEVNAGKDFGAKQVALLASMLSTTKSVRNKSGKFDYIVSDPTQPVSPGVERYAYLIRSGIAFSRDDAHLVRELEDVIDREPYTLTVRPKNGKPVQLFTIHTVPTKKGPEQEVRALLTSQTVKNADRAIFAGDFNLPASTTDKIFEQMGYKGLIREKTSLKQALDARGGYLYHQYDNIYVKGIEVCESGVIDFVSGYFSPVTNESLREARDVSDHSPVYVIFR